jgi:hypothetical protein
MGEVAGAKEILELLEELLKLLLELAKTKPLPDSLKSILAALVSKRLVSDCELLVADFSSLVYRAGPTGHKNHIQHRKLSAITEVFRKLVAGTKAKKIIFVIDGEGGIEKSSDKNRKKSRRTFENQKALQEALKEALEGKFDEGAVSFYQASHEADFSIRQVIKKVIEENEQQYKHIGLIADDHDFIPCCLSLNIYGVFKTTSMENPEKAFTTSHDHFRLVTEFFSVLANDVEFETNFSEFLKSKKQQPLGKIYETLSSLFTGLMRSLSSEQVDAGVQPTLTVAVRLFFWLFCFVTRKEGFKFVNVGPVTALTALSGAISRINTATTPPSLWWVQIVSDVFNSCAQRSTVDSQAIKATTFQAWRHFIDWVFPVCVHQHAELNQRYTPKRLVNDKELFQLLKRELPPINDALYHYLCDKQKPYLFQYQQPSSSRHRTDPKKVTTSGKQAQDSQKLAARRGEDMRVSKKLQKRNLIVSLASSMVGQAEQLQDHSLKKKETKCGKTFKSLLSFLVLHMMPHSNLPPLTLLHIQVLAGEEGRMFGRILWFLKAIWI